MVWDTQGEQGAPRAEELVQDGIIQVSKELGSLYAGPRSDLLAVMGKWTQGLCTKGAGLGMVKLTCLPRFPFYLETRRESPEEGRGKVGFHEDTHVQHTVVQTGICVHSCVCRSGCLLRPPVERVHTAHISPMHGEELFTYAGKSFHIQAPVLGRASWFLQVASLSCAPGFSMNPKAPKFSSS